MGFSFSGGTHLERVTQKVLGGFSFSGGIHLESVTQKVLGGFSFSGDTHLERVTQKVLGVFIQWRRTSRACDSEGLWGFHSVEAHI